MDDIMKQAVWNELKLTLEKWTNMTTLLESADGSKRVTQQDLDKTRRKIVDLESMLDAARRSAETKP